MSAPPIIIVADPDPLIGSILRVEFTQLEFAVMMAATAREAEDYAARAVASLVVLDVGALRLSGYTACARIRRRQGYAARPIVLTSGLVTPPMREAADTAGATVLLAKPYSVDDLRNAIAPHVPADDPLTRRPGRLGVGQEWTRVSLLPEQAGRDSALTRNALLLPIVRAAGKKIPLYRKT